jgi:SAM-dependent methyltransferase
VYRLHDRVRLVPGTFDLVECRSCGVQFLAPMPDLGRPDPFYEAYWDADPDAAPSLAGRLEAAYKRLLNWSELVRLRRWLRPGARVLDAGCGGGDALSILARWGYDCHGLEASEAGVRLTRSRLGVDARQGTLEHNDLEAGTSTRSCLPRDRAPAGAAAGARGGEAAPSSGRDLPMLPASTRLQRCRSLGGGVYHPGTWSTTRRAPSPGCWRKRVSWPAPFTTSR